ncbi:MAG: GerMN domain-containing protein [Caldisericia bacterium]|jgi:germination protein M|nr:GerMN domain-containing protein [Caldisericia bacterium]
MRKKVIKKRVYKERRFALIFILIFIVIFLFSLRFFSFNPQNENVKIYFYEKKSNELVFEKRVIPKYRNLTEKIKRLVEEVIKGPKSETLEKVVDPNTKILSIDIDKDRVIISFSKDIKNRVLEGVSGEAASLYSIVNTIIGNTSLRSVDILIENKRENFYWESISISSPLGFLSSKIPSGKKIFLYYYDKNLEYPVLIQSEIQEPKDNLEWAKLIFDKLKSGPPTIYENYLSKTIPDIATLKEIKIEGDKVILNFSPDILSYKGFGSSSEIAFMYSITLSMTEIPGIKKVQFLVDGKIVETIGGNFETLKPITRWYYDLNPPPENMYGYPIYFVLKIDDKFFISPQIVFTNKKDEAKLIFDKLLTPIKPLETFIPNGAKLNSYSIKNEILSLDIALDPSKIDSKEKEEFMMKQILLTYFDSMNVKEINISINGKKIKLPFGTDLTKSFTKDSL